MGELELELDVAAEPRRVLAERQCLLCGRRGTRWFVSPSGGRLPREGGSAICSAKGPCERRRRALLSTALRAPRRQRL